MAEFELQEKVLRLQEERLALKEQIFKLKKNADLCANNKKRTFSERQER